MVRVGVVRETVPGERRVSLVPETVGRLRKSSVEVAVETGAGADAYFPDDEFARAGAQLAADRKSLLDSADIVTGVQPPTSEEITQARSATVFVGFFSPSRNLALVEQMKEAGVTAFALELLPRITRAQVMDALSSQATAAGYRSVLLGAERSPKFLPMLTTAAGTIRPAKVLILGAGVAGLMAIATARRLGAVVEAYDVRRAAGEQVRSLGAKFLELEINAEGSGGYARELTPEEKQLEKKMVADAVAQADIVVTTANIPGRRAPLLVDRSMVDNMRPGAVIVDLAAESGGNCELTQSGRDVVAHGVTILGPVNLPSEVAFHASQMYSRNVEAFVGLLVDKSGQMTREYSDEILAASLLVHDGRVTHSPTRELLEKQHAE